MISECLDDFWFAIGKKGRGHRNTNVIRIVEKIGLFELVILKCFLDGKLIWAFPCGSGFTLYLFPPKMPGRKKDAASIPNAALSISFLRELSDFVVKKKKKFAARHKDHKEIIGY